MSRLALVQHKLADSSASDDQSDIRLFIDPPLTEVVIESIAYVTSLEHEGDSLTIVLAQSAQQLRHRNQEPSREIADPDILRRHEIVGRL
jgi:hypothetical protein